MAVLLPKFKTVQKQVDDVNRGTRENLTGLKVVRAFNAEKYQEDKFESVNENLMKTQMFTMRGMAFLFPVMIFVQSALSLGIYWLGAKLVDDISIPLNGTMTEIFTAIGSRADMLGDVVAFNSYALYVVMAFVLLLMIFVMLPRAQVSAGRINEVLNSDIAVREGKDDGRQTEEKGSITFNDVSFRYPGAAENCLEHISFQVNQGETLAIIGATGSGKSTLTNMLTGIYSIGSGTFILDGKEIHPKNQVEANNEGVSIIVQELGTLSGLTVAENIFLGHEEQFVHFGIKNTKAMNRKATELLKKYGFDRIKASDIIDNYNFEDRKLVEIVKATYFDPKIVVVDETTTALSQEGREELYKHMDRIRNSGNSVIFISHDLPEVLEKSDTITILRDGVYIDTVKSADVTEDDLKRLMVGREVTGDYYRADYGEKVSDEVVLSVKWSEVPGIFTKDRCLVSADCPSPVCTRSEKRFSAHPTTERAR